MCLLIVSCFAFLALHLGISGTPLGELLQNSLSESPYLSVYSLLSLGSLGVVIYGYVQAPHVGFIWVPSVLAYKVAKVFMLLALVTIVMGALVKTPTAVMNERVLDYEVSGLLNITRHPILWSVLLFARAHLLANRDYASILFFGTFVLLSFFGMLSMDQGRRQKSDPKWRIFMDKTSMVSFAALLRGRLRFRLADINWLSSIVGFTLYASIYCYMA